MRSLFVMLAMAMFISPAAAAWEVSTHTDPMTDLTVTVATLPAVTGQGTLRVACLDGRRTPEITFPTQVSFLRLDTKYRFDDGAVVSRTAPVSRDGRALWLWSRDPAGGVKRLAKAKRLRVQMFPVGAPTSFVDFETAGAESAFKQLKCK